MAGGVTHPTPLVNQYRAAGVRWHAGATRSAAV